jgi:hypothetical protein
MMGIVIAVMFQVDVFWVVTPCIAAVGYQRFGGPWYLHLQGEVNGALEAGTNILVDESCKL